jgi:hypothetical protein
MTLMTSVSTLLHLRQIRVGTILESLVARQVHGRGTGIGHGQAGQAQAGIVVTVGNVTGDALDCRHAKLHLSTARTGKTTTYCCCYHCYSTMRWAAIRAVANSYNNGV